MADTDKKVTDTDTKEAAKPEKEASPQKAGGKISIVTWAIMAVAVVLFAGSGFMLGRLFAGPAQTQAEESVQEEAQQSEQTEKKTANDGSQKSNTDTWYYDELESVVVNPDEPGATRYVRVGLTLEMSSELTNMKASEIILAQKPLLINWLNLYFKSLTLDQMQNDKDIKRILSQICDAFNEMLFPGAKPQIEKILIREFNIQ
ncbi:MAG: flagellar basal body-associated FliL family protein [Phycisphaerae bacterium]|nr:flagellar basal body-associated FliL family protein [Phycisphaerae bacterium]